MMYQGTVMTLFEPNIVVDAVGRVMSMWQPDFNCLKREVAKVQALPYAPAWNVRTRMTCQPGYNIFIPNAPTGSILGMHVFAPRRGRWLEQVTAGYGILPDELYNLIRMSNEALDPVLASRRSASAHGEHLGNWSLQKSINEMIAQYEEWLPAVEDDDPQDLNYEQITDDAGSTREGAIQAVLGIILALFTICLTHRLMLWARRRGMVLVQ